ncbi:MAG: hypothetical protein Q9166_005996 [cf. Caloplaca sp. 2 TL-2023]
MAFLLFLGTSVLAYFLWTVYSIFQNYQIARRIGLPIVISPVSTLNPLWVLTWRSFPAILRLRHLPFGLGTWARCTSMGWAFQDKHKLHDEIGPLFTLVTPAANEVTVADPEVAHTVLVRRKDYIKPAVMYGFGESYSFDEGVRKVAPGHDMNYRDSLSLCLNNIITFAIIPKQYLSLSFLPQQLRKLGKAAREFQQYMEEMLARERSSGAKGKPETPNLMSALVRASDEDMQAKESGQNSKLGLTDEEIFGNIFVYNLAGHETTANTVAYALVLLAAHPECQEWVREEIKQTGDTANEDYDMTFPRLQRCLAVMRLVSRDGKDIILPPSTAVNINVQALHTIPKTWGADSLTWRPSRWFVGSGSGTAQEGKPSSQAFVTPPQGSFIPWADGPRVCPGQKFAQVEFVAVMATLLGRYRIKPVLEAGQSEEAGRRALMAMADDSAISAITLQMNQPGKVALHWEAISE